jgi:hypothetical protein
MNPPYSSQVRPGETILARERLHRGIFILPIILLFAILIPEIILIVLLQNLLQPLFSIAGTAEIGRSLAPFYAIFLVLGATPAIFVFVVTWIAYLKSEATLTDKRLIFRTGLLSRSSGELPLENVEAIYISESILGRLLGYGTVAVTTVGAATFPLYYIGSPQRFHSLVQQAVAAAKAPGRRTTPQSTAPPPDDDSRYMPKYVR